MAVSSMVWWLLAALTVSDCWAAIANKRQTLPNIENGWPLPDQDVGEKADLMIQMPSCLAVNGVCVLRQNCQEEYIHETSDLCGEQADAVCCLTRSVFEKHVLQLKSCADTGSVCAFEEDCPEQDRHTNPLLCGDQAGVTCCRTLPQNIPNLHPRRAHNVQIFSCEYQGGICRQEEQCPEADRLGDSDACGDQPYITCCQASDIDPPTMPFEIAPSKKSSDKKYFELKYKRSHSAQIESCEARGGICRQKDQCGVEDRMGTSDICGDQPYITCCRATNLDRPLPNKRSPKDNVKRRAHSEQSESCNAQGGMCKQKKLCPEEDRMGTFDSCGDNPLITCCQFSSQLNEISQKKRTPEQLPDVPQNKSSNLGIQRPMHMATTLCESKRGTCKQESHCPEQDRLGSSDMCADEPNVTCCLSSSSFPDSINEIKKRRAHSVQLDSCRAKTGMCTYAANCPEEDQLGVDLCGGQDNITCCHLSFLEPAKSPDSEEDEQSAEAVPEKRAIANWADGKEKRRGLPIQIKSCTAQGGVCKKKIECPQEDYIDASDICGKPYELIYTCCRVSDASVTKRRAHSDELQSCRAQGGMCRQTDQCPESDRLGEESCGDVPNISCCKKASTSLSPEAEPRMIGSPIFNLNCLMRGGLCKNNEDCFPEDRYKDAELCGSQTGVSCCKRLPPRVGECSANGVGECVPASVCQNGQRNWFGKCSGGDVCCIWTRMMKPSDVN